MQQEFSSWAFNDLREVANCNGLAYAYYSITAHRFAGITSLLGKLHELMRELSPSLNTKEWCKKIPETFFSFVSPWSYYWVYVAELRCETNTGTPALIKYTDTGLRRDSTQAQKCNSPPWGPGSLKPLMLLWSKLGPQQILSLAVKAPARQCTLPNSVLVVL